ncbi:multicopper oxidase-domain-containing protein [Tricladium varicosporioides]|nr:multicopper oxidase-domain-containing protein [Hymenoscyphus varicosporioides]
MNNNPYDGPEGVTQCGIQYLQSFEYIWPAKEAGTFWIHSHHIGQYPHGLRSPLIVKHPDDPVVYKYDAAKDFTVSVSEWFRDSVDSVDNQYKSGACGKGLEYPPSAVILNEKLSSEIAAGGFTGKMRLRFVNMSAFATIIIYLTGGLRMAVIEIDGVAVNVNSLRYARAIELNAGQRISVLVDTADAGDNFNIYATIDESHYGGNKCAPQGPHQAFRAVGYVKFDGMPNKRALDTYPRTANTPSSYDTSYLWVQDSHFANLPEWADKFRSNATVVSDNWYYDSLRPATPIQRIKFKNGTTPLDQTRLIYIDLTATAGNTEFANMNSNIFKQQDIPVLLQAIRPAPTNCQAGKTPSIAQGTREFYGTNNTYNLTPGEQVILVISSYVGAHTFHLHGHNFQVLYLQPERSPSETTPSTPPQPDAWKIRSNKYTMPEYPARRDTLFITKKTYAIVAFTADNVGSWFFHCHNDFHAMSGMAGVFVTGQDALSGKGGVRGSGQWGGLVYGQCFYGNPGGVSTFQRPCLT